MDFGSINHIAVLVAGAAGFAFGAGYYTLLSKPWVAATGKTEEELKADFSPIIFVVTGICQFVIAVVLAGVISHLGDGAVTVGNSLTIAVFIWAGFVVTTMIVNHSFQGQKQSLTLIDGAHWLGVLLLQGLVIGLFGA